jgi:hypothetical protein
MKEKSKALLDAIKRKDQAALMMILGGKQQ